MIGVTSKPPDQQDPFISLEGEKHSSMRFVLQNVLQIVLQNRAINPQYLVK